MPAEELKRPDEAAMFRILARHPYSPEGVILRLAWQEGLSRKELNELTWDQVDLDGGSILLPDRTVPLEPSVADCLRERYVRYRKLSRPPARATAVTPAMGRPTALTARPAKAGQRLVPACAPRCGGKIRFPAPKNMENSVKLTKSRLLPESFCIGQTPRFFPASRMTGIDTIQFIVLYISCQELKT